MTGQHFHQHRWIIVAAASLYVWALLAFEHFNGGVISHHLLQRDDLPAISNWWGALLLPVLSWFLTGRTYRRVVTGYSLAVVAGFLGALLFGVLLSVLFQYQQQQMLSVLMLSLPVLALIFPLYRAECLLGFVLGMCFTFGALIPTGVGVLVVLMSFILHKTLRPLFGFAFHSLLSSQRSK
ncbi:MAG: hypothetical protein A2203_15330 [Chromatiales bacterium RIFOXYA1_FULL_46_5]|nr:MAG: hypothetical protein A2203_15330 [Chromatiales bacterium RIFOXYA1_FULL_46_5]